MNDDLLARLSAESYGAPPDITGRFLLGTHAIVRRLPEGLVVAFRGTDDPGDWIMDVMAAPRLTYYRDAAAATKIVFMHRGFYMAASSVYKAVCKAVGQEKFYLTGHSLGGAIALIIGYMRVTSGLPPEAIVTFGAPKAGFNAFAEALANIPVRQYRRGNDPVPHLPLALPYFPYRHVTAPLVQCGEDDTSNPFACHHIAGYAVDVTKYLAAKIATA